MSYIDNIKSAGRQLTKKVQYRKNGNWAYINEDNFVSAKWGFNCEITDGTIMSWLELELKEDLGLDPTTDLLRFSIDATANGTTQNKSYGNFYLKEKPEYDANNKTYKYQLYDAMLKTMIPYEEISGTYPMTCQSYFNTVVRTNLGVSTTISLGITGNMTLDSDPYSGLNFTYRDVISDILQANGILAYINTSNVLLATNWLSSTTPTITIDDDVLKNVNAELGKKFGPINSLTLAEGTDKVVETDNASISTNGITNITIADNHLLKDTRNTYISALFNRFSGYEWYIYDTELTGYGGFNFMAKININTNSNNYYTYVFNNEIFVDEGFTETIYSNESDAQEGTYTYTNAGKKASIVIDEKIGEVDIRGKTIKLTADDINIESNNFNVDTDGNLTCNNASMKGASINGGALELHDLGGNNRSSIRIQKDESTYTPTVGNSQNIYSISFETPSDYISSTNTAKTDFIQFTTTISGATETTTYSFTKTNDEELIEENIVNSGLGTDITNVIWRCYDDNGETIIESKQPHEWQTYKKYLTFTIYNNIDPTPYFVFINQVADSYTEVNSTYIKTHCYYAYPEESDINRNYSYSLLTNSRLNSTTTQATFKLNALDYSGSGSSGIEIAARTRNPATYPMPVQMVLTGNSWTRDILQNQVLWGPSAYYMNATQEVNLSHKVSEQPHGIILVWSAYTSGGAQDYNWHCDFIPKYLVGSSGFQYVSIMASNLFGNIATKGITIYDNKITGRADNTASGTSSATNIKYNNSTYVLRYVIGV